MATMHGKSSQVKLTTDIVADMGEWTINASLDTAEETAFGDSWKSYLAGLASWNGTCSGSFNVADAYQLIAHNYLIAATPVGTTAILRCFTNATNYYSGTIFMTGIRITAVIGDVVKIAFTFQGSGVLSYN